MMDEGVLHVYECRAALLAERRAVMLAAKAEWAADTRPFDHARANHIVNLGLYVYNARLRMRRLPQITDEGMQETTHYVRAPVTLEEVNHFVQRNYKVTLQWIRSPVHDRALVTWLPLSVCHDLTVPRRMQLIFNAVFLLPARGHDGGAVHADVPSADEAKAATKLIASASVTAAASDMEAVSLALKAERQAIIDAAFAKQLWRQDVTDGEGDDTPLPNELRWPKPIALIMYNDRLARHGHGPILFDCQSLVRYVYLPVTLTQVNEFVEWMARSSTPRWTRSCYDSRAFVAQLPPLFTQPEWTNRLWNAVYFLPIEEEDEQAQSRRGSSSSMGALVRSMPLL